MTGMTDSRAVELLREVSSTLPATHLHAERRAAIRHAIARLREPAGVGGFTAADMMDARQEGRKEAQQPAAVDGACGDACAP